MAGKSREKDGKAATEQTRKGEGSLSVKRRMGAFHAVPEVPEFGVVF